MVMAIEVGSGALSLIVQSLHTRHTTSIYERDWDQTFSALSRQSTAYHIGTQVYFAQSASMIKQGFSLLFKELLQSQGFTKEKLTQDPGADANSSSLSSSTHHDHHRNIILGIINVFYSKSHYSIPASFVTPPCQGHQAKKQVKGVSSKKFRAAGIPLAVPPYSRSS